MAKDYKSDVMMPPQGIRPWGGVTSTFSPPGGGDVLDYIRLYDSDGIQTAGSQVTAWNDSMGGRNFDGVIGAAANLTTTTVNGRTAVQGGGGVAIRAHDNAVDVPDNQDWTAVICISNLAMVDGAYLFDGSAFLGTTFPLWRSGANFRWGVGSASTNPYEHPYAPGDYVFILTCENNTGDQGQITAYVNGAVFSTVPGTPIVGNSLLAYQTFFSSRVGGSTATGAMCEGRVYDRLLSADEIAAVTSALASKYALSVS